MSTNPVDKPGYFTLEGNIQENTDLFDRSSTDLSISLHSLVPVLLSHLRTCKNDNGKIDNQPSL